MAPVGMRWSEQAVRDLEEIHDYIARNSPRYAAVVTGRLVGAADQVRQYPESGRVVPELGDPTVRGIVYELRAGEAEVLTVFRASRLFPPLER